MKKIARDPRLVQRLTASWQAGISADEIGSMLGMSKTSVTTLARELGLPPRERFAHEGYERSQAEAGRYAHRIGGDVTRRRRIIQPDPVRYRAAAPGFAIKHLDPETRALIDMALLAQPKAGRRVPA